MELFNRLSDEVLEAYQLVSARLEDGLNVLLGDGEAKSYPHTTHSSTAARDHDLDNLKLDGLSDEDIQDLMSGSPLEGIADHVMGDILSRHVGPSTVMERFYAFRAAIRWSESFIVGLLLFQVTACLMCFWASRKSRGLTPRLIVMAFIGVVVRSAETLNEIGSRNWERFATQNYFDKRGVFIGIMLCGPLLFDSFVMLVCFVYEASELLVDVKKRELQRKNRNERDSRAKKHD